MTAEVPTSMQFAAVGDHKLAYWERGTGAPVILVHGGLSAQMLAPVEQALAGSTSRRVLFHRHGYGRSPRPRHRRPLGLADHAADVVGLLDHLDVGAAHLVGHSLGALVALTVAASEPDRVASLGLLEPPVPLSHDAGARWAASIAPSVESYAAGDLEGAVDAFYAATLREGWRGRMDQISPGAFQDSVDGAAMAFESDLPGLQWDEGLTVDQVSTVRCPILVLIGSHTLPVFRDAADVFRAWFPWCETVEVPGVDHMMPLLESQAVAAAVESFVERVSTGTTAGRAGARPPSPSRRTRRVTTDDGVTVRGTVEGRGPSLVFLQGVLGDSDLDWGPVVRYLANDFTCHLPSMRGRGRSDEHPNLMMDRICLDYVTYVQSLQEEVALVGWSAGAGHALAVSATLDAVTRTAVYEPMVSMAMSQEDRADLGEALAEGRRLLLEGDTTGAMRALAAHPLSATDFAATETSRYLDAAAPYVPQVLEVFAQVSEYKGRFPEDPVVLGAITHPVLVLEGDRTIPLFTRSARHVLSQVADARSATVTGAGHAGPVTHPEAVADELRRFLDGESPLR